MPAAPAVDHEADDGLELLNQHSLSSLEEGLAALADREEEQAQRLERALTRRQGEGSAGASARPAARGPSKWAALKTANGHVRPDLLAQAQSLDASRHSGISAISTESRPRRSNSFRQTPRLMSVVMAYRDAMRPLRDPSKEKRVRFKETKQKKSWKRLEPFDPRSPFIRHFKAMSLIFLSITFFRLPVFIAFATRNIMWDLMADWYFLLAHILALNTGYIQKDMLVMDRRRIFDKWCSYTEFEKGERENVFVFVMEFLPFYGLAVAGPMFHVPEWLLILGTVPRTRRLYDLLRYFHALEVNLDTDMRKVAVMKYALVMLGCAHWFGCLWWFTARISGFPDRCWIRQYIEAAGLHMDPHQLSGHYPEYIISLMWGFATMVGIGYMGYMSEIFQEILLVLILTFCQVLIYSFLFGILLHYIVKRDAEREKYKMLMSKVDQYGHLFDLPRNLLEHMRRFYTFQYIKKIGEDEEILNAVPMALRTKIMANRYSMVAANEVFAGCDKHFVSAILAALRPKILIPGTAIYYRNDVAREVCFLESGLVEVYDEDERTVFRTVRPEQQFYPPIGGLAFFLGIPQPFTFCASSCSDVRLLTLSKEDYDEIKDRYPESRDRLIVNIRRSVGIIDDDVEAEEEEEHRAAVTLLAEAEIKKEGSVKVAELKRKITEALRRKQEEDVATIFNAIREGDVEEVKNMMLRGFDPNAVDYDGRSALHFAAVQGDDRIVEALLQRGADVHLRDRWGRNAIQDAVDNNHILVTKLLAGQGAEFKLRNVAVRLCSAALSDDLFELQRLVENGIDVNTSDYDKRTALHLGACGGNTKIVEFILLPMTKGNASVKDRWGISPLFDAIKHENPAVARILYENAAALSLDRAATFLCTAAADGDFPMLRLLHECGVKMNIGDYDNRYLIHLAAAEGEVVSVDFLIFAGADLSVKDRWGRTPLDDAIAGGHWSSAKLLLCYGAAHSDAITEAVEQALADTSVDEIRAFVQQEKVQQERRKDTEKRLRDNVKWISADSTTWLKTLAERLGNLQRLVEKMNRGEDGDYVLSESGAFMEQEDDDILTPQKPSKSNVPSLPGDESTKQAYMLSRYVSEARASSSTGLQSSSSIKPVKSLVQFFLQVSLIESALRTLKSRLPKDFSTYDEVAVQRALQSYGVRPSPEEMAGLMRKARSNKLGSQPASRGGSVSPGRSRDGRSVSGGITWEQLLMCMPFWTAIMGAEPQSDRYLKKLQEAISTIIEGFKLLDKDGNGKLSRAEWRLDKKEHDVGDFGAGIDEVFASTDFLTLESFIKVVADWVGVTSQEHESADDEDEEGQGWVDAAELEQHGSSPRGQPGVSPAPASTITTVTVPGKQAAMDRRQSSHSLRSMGEGSFRCGLDSPPPSMRHKAGGSEEKSKRGPNPLQSGVSFEGLIEREAHKLQDSWWSWGKRSYRNLRLWRVQRKLAQHALKESVARPEDIANRFSRLDVADLGWINRSRTEALLRWTFAADERLEWDFEVVLDYLDEAAGNTGRITLDVIQNFVEATIEGGQGPFAWRNHKYMLIPSSQTSDTASSSVVHSKPSFVFDNTGLFARCWSKFMLVVSLYYFLSVPYHIAFLRHKLLTTYVHCLTVSYAFDAVLALDVLIKFNMAYTDERSVKVFDRAKIRRRYFMSSFFFDFVAVLPIDVLARMVGSRSNYIAWLRLTKLRHAPDLYYWLFSPTSSDNANRLLVEGQQLYLTLFAVCHLLGCVWYFITKEERENYQAISDYHRYGDYTNGSDNGGVILVHYYIMCFSYVGLLISGMGYSDVVVGRITEQLFVILCFVLNISAWSYIIGTISGLFVSADETIAASHELMQSVVRFIKNNNVSPESAEELKQFFSKAGPGKLSLSDERYIYRNLPLSMQIQVARHVSRDTVVSVELFQGTSDSFLDSVCTILLTEMLSPGDFLFKTDDVCRCLYIVNSGSVEIVNWDPNTSEYAVQEIVEAGQAIGQIEFCFDIRYLRAARAAGVVRLFRLPREEYNRMIKLYPSDEDIIFQNLALLSEDDKAIETGSQIVPKSIAGSSSMSVESDVRSMMNEGILLDRAMDGIMKAKRKSEEQRVRSLCNAAATGDLEQISRLLNSGLSIDSTDANNRSALMLATCSGNLELVKWLIDRGANPNLRDSFGGCALADALAGNHIEIMAYLKKSGAVLELEDAAGDMCQAGAEGNVELLRQYLALGVDPDVADHDKRTALHLAASEGHVECVKLLLSKWANVNPIDRMGGTPLMDAVRHGHFEVADYLRDHGGILNIQPIELGTHLCEAAAQGDIEKLRILERYGADMNQGDYDGRTALHLASCCNRLGVIEYLISLPSIDINPLDRFCHTPYDDSIRERQEAIRNVLQAHGGLPGRDEQLRDAVARHLQRPKDVARAKALRREKNMTLFRRQTALLEKMTEIYKVMSDNLPTYCKAISVLSMTIRNRKSTSVIDRGTRPDLHNTRLYFYNSFRAYLDKVYLQNLDNFVCLVEEFENATIDDHRNTLANRIMGHFFVASSSDYIQMNPSAVTELQSRYVEGDRGADLFEPCKGYVVEEMRGLLPGFYKSEDYYAACRKPDGFLWRVTKLCRVVYTLSARLLDKVAVPLLQMCDEDELSCVPHYTASARISFRQICAGFERHVTQIKEMTHVLCFLVKEQCIKEELRELHSKETLGRTQKRNYLS